MMKKLTALAGTLVLCACIEVADMGDIWAKGAIDPALEGRWLMKAADHLPKQGDKEEFYTFTRQGDAYRVTVEKEEGEEDEAFLVRTLTIGDLDFLMLKDEPRPNVRLDNSGDLWPYVAKDGISFIRLTKKAEEKIVKESGGLLTLGYNDDHVTQYRLEKLDAASLAVLEKLAEDPDPSLWEEWARGTKSPP
jgi:hypothetical protein